MTDKALEAALPGEAEVVGWAYRGPRGGLIVTEEKPKHAPEAVPLVTLASLQAMQARAEKAERENEALIDDAQKAWAKHGGMEIAKGQWQARAEAAEARVKELEEALKPFVPVYEPWMDKHADNVGLGFYRPATFGDLRRARTALKGGSNG